MARLNRKSMAKIVLAVVAVTMFFTHVYAQEWKFIPIYPLYNLAYLFQDQSDTCGKAAEIKLVKNSSTSYSEAVFASIGQVNDVDWFVVELPSHKYGGFIVSTTGNTNTFGQIYINDCTKKNSDGASNDLNEEDKNFWIYHGTAYPEMQKIYIKVSAAGGDIGFYTLHIDFFI